MPQILPTAQRVLQVFEVYARERRPLTNSEMARFLDLADSSCSDLLYTLRQAGYLLRTPKSRYFHPTGRLLDVSRYESRSAGARRALRIDVQSKLRRQAR